MMMPLMMIHQFGVLLYLSCSDICEDFGHSGELWWLDIVYVVVAYGFVYLLGGGLNGNK